MVLPMAVAKELAAVFSFWRTSGSWSAVDTDSATWSQALARVPKASLISSSDGPPSEATLR
jgi:hypothetical protein